MSSGGFPRPPASGNFEDGIRDHGLLASVAFLVLIPSGVLFTRYVRTFTTKLVHWHTFSIEMNVDSLPLPGGGLFTAY
jgi:hypothetical protein